MSMSIEAWCKDHHAEYPTVQYLIPEGTVFHRRHNMSIDLQGWSIDVEPGSIDQFDAQGNLVYDNEGESLYVTIIDPLGNNYEGYIPWTSQLSKSVIKRIKAQKENK
jgi:hypothetical protein